MKMYKKETSNAYIGHDSSKVDQDTLIIAEMIKIQQKQSAFRSSHYCIPIVINKEER